MSREPPSEGHVEDVIVRRQADSNAAARQRSDPAPSCHHVV